MNKKGFTLLEILGAITILGILLVIAVPRINNIIDNARINAHIQNEATFLRAARTFATVNNHLLPSNVGGTREIRLSDLRTNNKIDVIRDPNNRNIECSGYVLVTRLENNQLDFTPHLKCGNQNWIDDVTEDGLVLHYKFDDFQEPTQNLINPRAQWTVFSEIQNDWRLEQINEYTVKVTALRDNPAVSTWSNVAHVNTFVTVDPNVVVTYSAEIIERNTTLIFPSTSGWGTIEGFSMLGSRNARTITHNILWTHAFSIRASNASSIRAGDYIVVRNWQIERKPYATPFIDGIRTGVVRDYSTRNNHATLVQTTTPRWAEERGSGVYQFNGINQIINVSGYNLHNPTLYNGEATVSMWVRPSRHDVGLARYIAGFHYWMINSNGRLQNMVAKPGEGVNYWLFGNATIPIGEWTHLVYTIRDGVAVRYFVNGRLDAEHISSTLRIISYSSDSVIGAIWDGRFFENAMDDIRIYSRALSDDEIKRMYDTEIQKRR